jgi:hypothetical protein
LGLKNQNKNAKPPLQYFFLNGKATAMLVQQNVSSSKDIISIILTVFVNSNWIEDGAYNYCQTNSMPRINLS